jgi:hypothetical protein
MKVTFYPCGTWIQSSPTVMVAGRTQQGESLKP